MARRHTGTWLALLALSAGSSIQANSIRIPRAEFRQAYSLDPNGRVVVENLYGDVRITAWDRDEVLVEAVKTSADPRQLEDARIVVNSSRGKVSIQTQYAGGDAEHTASVQYRITVPRGANLENVKLVNGGLSITGLTGSIRASSINGSIRAEKLAGEADLSTVNGRVDAEFQRIAPAHEISLSSVNGPIRLSIPPGTGAELYARNTAGGIESQFGRVARETGGHRLRARINRGGARIRLHNVNGGIWIRAGITHRTERPVT